MLSVDFGKAEPDSFAQQHFWMAVTKDAPPKAEPPKADTLPKMDTMEVPEKPVFTPPTPQPDGNPQQPAHEPEQNQNR